MVAPLRQELRPQLERMREATRSTAAKATDLLALAEGVQAGPLRLLGEVEGLLGVVLAIKVSPPEYRRIVGTLSSFLQDAWGANDWLVRQAADDVAEIVDRGRAGGLSADKVQALARARVEQLQAGLGELGTAFADGQARDIGRFLTAAYALGGNEIGKALGWRLDFELGDHDAIQGLARSGIYWIGNHYGEALDQDRLLAVVRKLQLEQGLGRKAVGEALRDAFGTECKRSDPYWMGLAATMATRSRSFGALSSMERAGAWRYTYSNPLDERTSDVCEALNGTTFVVKGALDLRARLLEASSPEEWKAISAWPKLRDIEASPGNLLPPAELQARGIAWPPMHFHCRSSIEVEAWLPVTAADVDPAATTDVKTPAKPPKRKRKAKGKPQAGGPRSWREVRSDLAAVEKDMAARGLDPADVSTISTRARAAYQAWAPDPGQPPRDWLDRRAAALLESPGRKGRATVGSWLHELTGQQRRALEIRDPKSPRMRAIAELIDETLKGDLATHERRFALLREARQVAPRTVRERWRKAAVDTLLGERPKALTAAQWTAIREGVDDACRTYPEELLQLMASDGAQITHDARNGRAHASANAGRGARVVMDLRQLLAEGPRKGRRRTWRFDPEHRAATTVAHELGHVLDSTMGQTRIGAGTHGQPWSLWGGAVGGDAGKVWGKTYGDQFYTIAQRDKKGRFLFAKLPWEPSGTSTHYYAGDWIDAYEGRVYSGRATPTSAGVSAGSYGGPVEFIAMTTQRQREAQHLIRRGILPSNPDLVDLVPRASTRTITRFEASKAQHTRALYGHGHRDAGEAFLGAGSRVVDDLVADGAITAETFADDGDVVGFAMTVHYYTGADLEGLILGPNATLRPFLSSSAQRTGLVRQLLTEYAPGDKLDARAAVRSLRDVTSGTLPNYLKGSVRTDPPSPDQLAQAIAASPQEP